MSNTINIGGITVSKFYLGGSSDVKIYLGTTKLYPNVDYSNCFKFVATNSGTFTFTGNDIDYSLNSGLTWTTLSSGNATPTITAGSSILWKANGLTPTSSIGIGTFSSTANFTAAGNVMSLLYGDNFENQTSLSGKDHALRNLFAGCTTLTSVDNMSLPATTLSDSCYRAMFSGCTSLTSIVNLVLPATTMTDYCYFSMFHWCTSLTTVPKDLLPATNLSGTNYCYTNMFNRCTSLTKAPDLPATTLGVGCYYNMFYSGTSLTESPVLSAETLLQDSYRQMFQYCTNLNKITCLATNISASNCTNNWVANVAASGTFYKAASMTSWTTGASGIPTSWTKRDYNKHLTFTALESGTFKFSVNNISYSIDSGKTWNTLSADTNSPTLESGDTIMWKASGLTPTSGDGIGSFSSTCNFTAEGNIMSLHYGDNFEDQRSLSGKDNAFRGLFSGCTSLTSIENLELPATNLSKKCYDRMFYICTSLTTVPSDLLPATTLAENCYTRMFYGCTSLTTAPELPATTLAENCYDSMFQSCTSLTTAPEVPATTLENRCYTNMFSRCTSLTTPPQLPATALTTGCYYNMFYQNSSLSTSPVLPAPTLVQDCYRQMFYNCRSLNKIICLATSGINTNNSTSNWLSNTSSSGTFYRAAGVSWPTGNSGHKTWTLVDYSG